jgi:hypothetical protein
VPMRSRGLPRAGRMCPRTSLVSSVVRPVHSVKVDFTPGMLREIDERAARLNVSRQAVIKTLLGQALAGSKKKAD